MEHYQSDLRKEEIALRKTVVAPTSELPQQKKLTWNPKSVEGVNRRGKHIGYLNTFQLADIHPQKKLPPGMKEDDSFLIPRTFI